MLIRSNTINEFGKPHRPLTVILSENSSEFGVETLAFSDGVRFVPTKSSHEEGCRASQLSNQ